MRQRQYYLAVQVCFYLAIQSEFDSSTNKLVVIGIMDGLCSLTSTVIFTMLHVLMENPPHVFGLRGQNYPVAVVPVQFPQYAMWAFSP